MPDKIHLTVASVVTKADRYLMVREIRQGHEVYNQPAGHVEPGETLVDAAIRETLEETAWLVRPTGVISFSTYTAPSNGVTYYRLALACEPVSFDETLTIDEDIEEAVWLSYKQILARSSQMRSDMVLQAIEDYHAGTIYPLALLKTHR